MTTFEDFWQIARRWRNPYSNPRGRVASPGKREIRGAEPAWHIAIKEGADPEQIILGARGYLAHVEQDIDDPQKVCMASTFLNQCRWEQYAELATETAAREAEELLERRRDYWRSGRRDALQGIEPRPVADCYGPDIQKAYDQGYREAEKYLARPKLEVVK